MSEAHSGCYCLQPWGDASQLVQECPFKQPASDMFALLQELEKWVNGTLQRCAKVCPADERLLEHYARDVDEFLEPAAKRRKMQAEHAGELSAMPGWGPAAPSSSKGWSRHAGSCSG